MDSEEKMQVLLYCHHDDWDLQETFDVELEIRHLPMEGNVQIRHFRIDADHSNAYAEWVRQGRPNYPNDGQREAIVSRSALEYCEAPEVIPVHNGTLLRTFTLPTHAISLMEIVKVP